MAEAPVLLIIFNRPERTRELIRRLAEIKPAKLYVSADGPRRHVASDAQSCEETRAVIREISWPCQVETRFLDENLGCKQGPITAVDWLFQHEETGIILEDDCLPDPSFFAFCNSLLELYANNERIMHISGNNFQDGIQRGAGSYYFSKYTHNWGWATWKRAWVNFAPALARFEKFDRYGEIRKVPISRAAQRFWIRNFRYTMARNDSWDSLWMYSVWEAGGLSILPNKNLVTNVGFDQDATHTKQKDLKNMVPAESMGPLSHPQAVLLDEAADEYTFRRNFWRSLPRRVFDKARSVLKK